MAYTKGMIQTLITKIQTGELNSNFTYKEAGIHFATLNALVKRGYMDKNAASKYSLTPRGAAFARIEQLTQGCEYFVLRKPDAKLGMMCSIKGADLFDAWEQPYEFDAPIELSFNKPNSPVITIV